MAPLSQFAKLFTSALLATQVSAHFLLNYPATVGFDDDGEGTGPCGSETVDVAKANITDFHVGGDTIFVTSSHPTANFLYRATLDTTLKGSFVNLRPVEMAVGIGDNCQPSVAVPGNFSGQGVLQVIANSPDGILYQVCLRLHTTRNRISCIQSY
jgi:hypothetical protein